MMYEWLIIAVFDGNFIWMVSSARSIKDADSAYQSILRVYFHQRLGSQSAVNHDMMAGLRGLYQFYFKNCVNNQYYLYFIKSPGNQGIQTGGGRHRVD